MPRKFLPGFFVVVFFFAASHSHGQIILSDATKQEFVSHPGYYRAATNSKIEDVFRQPFKELDFSRASSLGFDPASHWFKIDVNNQSGKKHWLLEVAYGPLDHIELVYRDSTGHWVHFIGGDRYPISARPYKNRHVVFDLPLAQQRESTVYVHIQSTSSIQVPLLIWEPAAFNQAKYDEQFAHGVFYGIMLIMVFYNLFLFISIRDRTTLYYIITLIFGTNVIAFFQGYGFYYLYPEHPEFGNYFSALSAPCFIVASIALTRSFLLLRVFSPALDRILLATAIVCVLASVFIVVFETLFTYTSLHLLTIIDFVLILISASYCFYKNYRPARYFLLAWVSLLLVGVMFSLRNLGVIQGNWFTNNALYFGGIMQTLLISFALGDRINLLKKENEIARARELEMKREANARLEEEVRLRTEEIRQQNIQLEQNNSIKDKLFSILSHDLKGPLNSLRGTLSIWRLGALNPEEVKKLTTNIDEQLHQTSDFLDNLLQWAKSQMVGETVKPEKIEMEKLLKTATELLMPEFHRKHIRLHLSVTEDCIAYADPTMIHTVVRNLASNALKFTASDGEVHIMATRNNDWVEVTVKDNGVGISNNSMATIFTLQGVTTSGTREEKGTGIGLVLCKEFVERNGGKIDAQSQEGSGSIFRFTVPSAH